MSVRRSAGLLFLIVGLAVCNTPGAEPRESDFASTPSADFNEIALPNLVPIYWHVPRALTGPPWPWVDVVFGVTNNGTGPATGAWIDGIYPDDGRSRYAVAGPKTELAAGGAYWWTNRIQVPLTNSGTYRLVLDANTTRQLVEAAVQDNALTNTLEFTSVIPDLVPIGFTAPDILTLPEDDSVLMSWGVRNQGVGPAAGYPQWMDKIFLSKDEALGPDDMEVFSMNVLGPIMPGTSAWRSEKVSLQGQHPGAYYLILALNARNALIESATNNNVAVRPCLIQEAKPDLKALVFIAPSEITDYARPITYSWVVTNQGPGGVPRYSEWRDRLFFATDAKNRFTYHEIAEASFSGPMPAGATYSVIKQSDYLPYDNGAFILEIARDGDDLREKTNSNNFVTIPVSLPKCDLMFNYVERPVLVTDSAVEVSWSIINAGPGPTHPYWNLSVSIVLAKDGSTERRYAWADSQALRPGAIANFTNRFSGLYGRGPYQLRFEIDPYERQNDPSRQYNVVTHEFEVWSSAPDLALTSVQVETNLVFAPNEPISLTYNMSNAGPVRVTGWSMGCYLLDESTQNRLAWLGFPGQTNVMEPGTSAWFTNTIRLPHMQGRFLLSLEGSLPWNPETETNNNRFITPVSLDPRPADLEVAGWIVKTNPPGTKPPAFEYAWKVTNLGPGDFYAGTALEIMLRRLTNGSPGPVVCSNTFSGVIPAGSSIQGGNTLEFTDAAPGPDYWRIEMDDYKSPTNNNSAILVWTPDFRCDLAVTRLIATNSIAAKQNQAITVAIEATNLGRGMLRPGWYYGLSVDYLESGIQSDYRMVAPATVDRALAPGESLWFTNTLNLPILHSGDYRYRAFAYGPVAEDVTWANNLLDIPLNVQLPRPPQLRPQNFKATAYRNGSGVTLASSWSVINEGEGSAEPAWVDGLFYSEDDTWSWDDLALGRFTNSAVLVPAAGYGGALTTTLPGNIQQPGYIVFCLDLANELADADLLNNSRAVLLRILPAVPGPVGLTEPRLGSDGVFRAQAYGNAGSRALYQVSTDLVHWTTQQILTFEGPTLEVEDSAARNNPARFYRIMEE